MIHKKTYALFHPYMNVKGGAERKLYLLYNFLKKKGNTVKIITFDFNRANTFSKGLKETDIIILNRKLFIFEILKKISNHQFSVLISSNYPANIFSFFIRAKKRIFLCNEVALKKWMDLNNKVPKYKKFLDKLSQYLFQKIIANSNNTASEIKAYYGREASVVYSGLELEKMRHLEEEEISSLRNVSFFCTISRASFDKNIKFLENILDYLNLNSLNLMVVYAGSGPDIRYLEALDKRYTNFYYIKHVSEGQKKWLLKKCSKFLFLPVNEPLGVTILEALYYGSEIVSFASGGPKETLEAFPRYLHTTKDDYLSALLHSSNDYNLEDKIDWITNHFNAEQMCSKIIGV